MSKRRVSDLNGNSGHFDGAVARKKAKVTRKQDEENGLDSAVNKAVRLFSEHWVAFAIKRDASNADEVERDGRACQLGERMAAEKYEELKAAMLDLLPWVGPMKPATSTIQGRSYDVIEFEGKEPPSHIKKKLEAQKKKGQASVAEEKLQKAQLEWLRTFGNRTRGWEALCALLSTIAARGEMSWMESFHVATDIDSRVKKIPGCKSKGSAKRKAWIRQYIQDELQHGCGDFVSFMVHQGCTLRVSFVQAPGVRKQIPASLLISTREPLWEALQNQDDNGPVRFPQGIPWNGFRQKREWLMKAGRQFAFQLANLEGDEEDTRSGKSRVAIETLKPDPKLLALLRSRKPVVQLDVIAALAPRGVMKKEGLSEIVKAELANFTRDAKGRGEAVVFCLGSTNPHTLAQKVYLRPPIGDHGLQCGYLRWRDSPDVAWARERSWEDRICLCLQMP